jgi:hypothetical protein
MVIKFKDKNFSSVFAERMQQKLDFVINYLLELKLIIELILIFDKSKSLIFEIDL